MISLIGWLLLRNVFRRDRDPMARFATRFFLVMTVLEILVSVGIVWAVYKLVVSGDA